MTPKDDLGQATVGGDQSGVIAIAAGNDHTVALNADGAVDAWGENSSGQATVPAGLSGVTAIAAGLDCSLAVRNDGTVVPWGNVTVPGGLNGVRAVAAGYLHYLALKTDGTVVAWGYNSNGQATVPAAAQSGVSAVAAGYSHSAALKTDGTVVVWGANDVGQLNVPAGLNGVVAIAAGYYFTVALKSDGTVVAWGMTFGGVSTVPVEAQSGVSKIAANYYHTMALKSDGTVVTWGYDNGYGELDVPAGLSGVTAMAAGYFHTAVLIGTAGVDFGNLVAGSIGTPKTFTIRNTGPGPLSITGVSTLGHTGDYALNTSGMLTSIPAGGQTNFTVTFQPKAPGSRPAILRLLSDDANNGTADIALTGGGRTPIENWRQSYFSSIVNDGIGGDFYDFDLDGIVNIVEFGFGLNPRLPGPPQIPQWQKIGGNYVVNFSTPGGVSGMSNGAEWSTTLSSGSWHEIPDTGIAPQHSFILPIGSNPRLFWRFAIGEDPNFVPNPLPGAGAAQSSDYYAGAPYLASNALDGNPSTFTHTAANDPDPTWTVTLPFATPISEIVLYNRTQGWQERLRNITVRVFSDAAGTVPVFTSTVLDPDNVLNGPAILSVSTGNVDARVIRVSRGLSDNPIGDDRCLTLGEVKLSDP